MKDINRYVTLRTYANAQPIAADMFEIRSTAIPVVEENQVLLQPMILGADPSLRLFMSGTTKRFMHQFAIGAPIRWMGVARIVESRHPHYTPGDLVSGMVDWADYSVWDGNMANGALGALVPIPSFIKKTSHALGVLGTSGLTAYFGITKIARPKPGETMLVSSAAGGVGSVAGQMAKLMGATVIGLTSTKAKRELLLKLGFDAALDYRADDFEAQLQKTIPKGIDIYYDNVGGQLSQQIMKTMQYPARIIECGQIAIYEDDQEGFMVDIRHIHMNGLRLEGFELSLFQEEFPHALIQLAQWVDEGKLKVIETTYQSLEEAPKAMVDLFQGKGVGKMIIAL